MELGIKKLWNKTGHDTNIVLKVRKGSHPHDILKEVPVSIPEGEARTVHYGDDANPYLSGVTYEYRPSGSMVRFSAEVETRGSSWDNVFNTNDMLTFHAISSAESISGSNP